MQLSQTQIYNMLDYVHISHKQKASSNGWLSIICPNQFHNDSNFGNCGINLNSGAISCFSCGYKSHIIQEIKKHYHFETYQDLLNFLQFNFNVVSTSASFIQEPPKEKPVITKKFDTKKQEYTGYLVKDIDISKSVYLQRRGFTKEFCDEFNIKHCLNSYYFDYFAIPIIDTEKDIVSIEFRKLFQEEYLNKFFEAHQKGMFLPEEYSDEKADFFEKYCELLCITMGDDNKLYQAGKEFHDSIIHYLLSPKVKYEKYSRINETIWNTDNLDFDADLYLSEGIGSIPKLYQYISKNCTCTFGSNILQAQLDILKKFKKRIILIKDPDKAGDKMLLTLFCELKNVYLINTLFDDTDDDYVNDILHTEPVEASDYVAKYLAETETLF